MNTNLRTFFIKLLLPFTLCCCLTTVAHAAGSQRIANVVNFIRNYEPRDPSCTNEVLVSTVKSQIECMRKSNISGTFLLQYDALINPDYQHLLRDNTDVCADIGAWWEITQPQVEAAGLKWRGRYAWDWFAQYDFSIGYTPVERRQLVDVFMSKFKEIFGYYPHSVGGWYIDEVTLAYMHDRYGVEASCMCRDQIGTDGYTLWGGYWCGAFYPSRRNGYLPGQTKQGQIDVPTFRLLGSDPIHQYDAGLGGIWQGVVTLEPTCSDGGGSATWTDWYLKTMTEDPCLGYTYMQAGQENMFMWQRMKAGYELQMPRIAKLRDSGVLRVETLLESARAFHKKYKVTPPTAQVSLTDYNKTTDSRSVWYNSRFYRTNIITEGNKLRIRDIHVFSEQYPSPYLNSVVRTNDFRLLALPVVDGFQWSNSDTVASLRPYYRDLQGEWHEMKGGVIKAQATGSSTMQVEWPLEGEAGACLTFVLNESTITMKLVNAKDVTDWKLELKTVARARLPFDNIGARLLTMSQSGYTYRVNALKGEFSRGAGVTRLIIKPTGNVVKLKLN
jgi:hypothetical protein